MRLIYTDSKEEVRVGDIATTLKGELVEVANFAAPHQPSCEGKVTVKRGSHANNFNEYFVSVINAEWIEREDFVSSTYPDPALDADEIVTHNGQTVHCYGDVKEDSYFGICCDDKAFDGICVDNTNDDNEGFKNWTQTVIYLLENYRPDIAQLKVLI